MTQRKRLLLAISIVMIVLLAVGYVWWRQTHSNALPDGIFRANGRLELTRLDVAAKYPGRLLSVDFREGDEVRAGQVLAVQEDTELRARLSQALATLSRARSEQARARSGQAAQARKVALARLEWRQARDLLRQEQISPVELERRRLALEAESAAESATAGAVDTAGYAVAEAQAQVALAQSMVDSMQLRAPIAGRVEYRVVEPGAMLPPGGRVATLLDPYDVSLTVFYPSDVAIRLKIGDEARIVLEGQDGEALPATVAMVDADAQFTPKYVETTRERQNLVYRVKLQVSRQVAERLRGRLKGGTTGDGYVRTRADAVWPPVLRVGSSRSS